MAELRIHERPVPRLPLALKPAGRFGLSRLVAQARQPGRRSSLSDIPIKNVKRLPDEFGLEEERLLMRRHEARIPAHP